MLPPVFIHSLYRSGSTYLFNVFRRSPRGYVCFQEPEHEFLINLEQDPDQLLKIDSSVSRELRHPLLDKPYFYEFYAIRDRLQGLFKKSFSFDGYFCPEDPGLPDDQLAYFKALVLGSEGRAVLQMCRSAGRAAALKRAFGGTHIHLWREPRNQWWSFKVNNSFDPALQMIYGAEGLPPVLAEVKARCKIADFHAASAEEEFAFFRWNPLDAATGYLAFYALWLYSFIELRRVCDVEISIDRLGDDDEYRQRTLDNLASLGITELDFHDVLMPRSQYADDEIPFYLEIEREVQAIFKGHGYADTDIEAVSELLRIIEAPENGVTGSECGDAVRARAVALSALDRFVTATHRIHLDENRLHDLSAFEYEKAELVEHLRYAQGELSIAQLRAEQQQAEFEVLKVESANLQQQLVEIRRQLKIARELGEKYRVSSQSNELERSRLEGYLKASEEQANELKRYFDEKINQFEREREQLYSAIAESLEHSREKFVTNQNPSEKAVR